MDLWGIITAVSVAASILSYVELKKGYVMLLASRLLFDSFDDVVMDELSKTIDVKLNGDMAVNVTMSGHVRFDMLHEKYVEIISETPHDLEDIEFSAKNELSGQAIDPIPHIFDKHYKRIGIPMGNVGRGKKFKISYCYKLPESFTFKMDAYCAHSALHNERKLNVVVRFEDGLVVSPASVRGTEITSGGVKKPVKENVKPLLSPTKPYVISFNLPRARKGSTYEIGWSAKLNRNH